MNQRNQKSLLMRKETIYAPVLESDRLLLRTMALDDTAFVFKHFGDPDVHRYLVDEEPVTNEDGAKEIVEWASNPQDISCTRWVIRLKETDQPVGTCGFHNWDQTNNRVEIGYDLAKSHWRQGISHEALGVMIASGYERMGINRIEAFVHLENVGSYRLLKKLGFHLEGIVRDKHLFRGEYYDHYCFSLLRSDLSPNPGAV
jgi:ribosomal-protein-alanine N-acetyltransferase